MSIFSSLGVRAKSAWNAFFSRDPTPTYDLGSSYVYRPDRMHFTRGNDRSIVTGIYNRIALDVSAVDLRHVKLNKDGQIDEVVKSGLNDCLELSANLDQTGRQFIQDAAQSMMDEGCIALVPIVTDDDPNVSDSYGIENLRTGKIMQWYPRHVKVDVYNEWDGRRHELVYEKKAVAIIENPLYAVMNEPNSILRRLVRKLTLLDIIDEKNASSKLDLIVSFPHIINRDRQRKQMEARIADIQKQLTDSEYGIVYMDGTEHITQLNRPIENNLMAHIEYLTNQLYSQLGITKEILDGSADEAAMLNYYSRTVEPILCAFAEEMRRKFLTQNARTRGHSIAYFRDPLKLVTVSKIAEIAGVLITNRVMTPNEVRPRIGLPPSSDSSADSLVNPNIDKVEDIDKTKNNDQPAEEVPNQNEEA